MTEDEAKTKVCCGPVASNCVAAACMAWRWSEAKRTAAFLDDIRAHMKATGVNMNKASDEVYRAKGETYAYTEGVCGLAGQP